jgi:hypothetical protein
MQAIAEQVDKEFGILVAWIQIVQLATKQASRTGFKQAWLVVFA